jgi:hypothetical protein
VKRDAFSAFATIVRSQRNGVHRERAGFESLVRLAYGMNAQGRQRTRRIEQILGSSETVRQACPSRDGRDETVRSTWRHVESGRNDLTLS